VSSITIETNLWWTVFSKADSKLLHGMNIMDYSILVGVHDFSQVVKDDDRPPSRRKSDIVRLPGADRLDLIVTVRPFCDS